MPHAIYNKNQSFLPLESYFLALSCLEEALPDCSLLQVSNLAAAELVPSRRLKSGCAKVYTFLFEAIKERLTVTETKDSSHCSGYSFTE